MSVRGRIKGKRETSNGRREGRMSGRKGEKEGRGGGGKFLYTRGREGEGM